MTANTVLSKKSTFQFLDEYILGEYILEINHLSFIEADDLALQIKKYVESEFKKLNPILSSLYDFEIEERDIVYGSRTSRHRGKLKKKKGKTWKDKIKTLFNTIALGISLSASDPKIIQENWHKVVHSIESVFSPGKNDVNIKDIKTFPIDNPKDFSNEADIN